MHASVDSRRANEDKWPRSAGTSSKGARTTAPANFQVRAVPDHTTAKHRCRLQIQWRHSDAEKVAEGILYGQGI